jgi:hypothetical protein
MLKANPILASLDAAKAGVLSCPQMKTIAKTKVARVPIGRLIGCMVCSSVDEKKKGGPN